MLYYKEEERMDTLLLIGDWEGRPNIPDLADIGVDRIVLLPDCDAYLGSMADEKLKEIHELIHKLEEG